MKLVRKRGTFCLFTSKKIYVFQFSFKDPWLYPHKDNHYLDDFLTLYGWLFFYFGWVNK